jgi:hypothetical protein
MLRAAVALPIILGAFLALGCGEDIHHSLTDLEVGDCVVEPQQLEVALVDPIPCDNANLNVFG